jgi:6-pyruvoyltetrahydropterin/6-carboxytetrahydropterin synthase
MAHALNGYKGDCKYIHGHSYELHVTVRSIISEDSYINPPGFVIDFKELKKLIKEKVIEKFDHRLVLSQAFLKENPIGFQENLFVFEAEPSAENLLIYISRILRKNLSPDIKLIKLKLFETRDSYAVWTVGLE